MTFLKGCGWFIVLLPLMWLVYDVPLSLVVSAYSKIRYGQVLHYPKMPALLVFLGIVATFFIGAALARVLNADDTAIYGAVCARSTVYAFFRY